MLAGIHVDNLFLDTTYADAKYVFPAQEETVEFIARTIAHEVEASSGKQGLAATRHYNIALVVYSGSPFVAYQACLHAGRTLVLVATYNIGKEKILLRAHELTGSKIVWHRGVLPCPLPSLSTS